MRSFLIRILLYAAAVLGALYCVVLMADGSTDPFYVRVTTPRQAGLIVGASRSAQGLVPSVMPVGASPDFNFSFAATHSPYGPTYLEAIRKKMDPAARNAVHYVVVEPWSVCGAKDAPNDPSLFKEAETFLGTLPSMTSDPNIMYFIQGTQKRMVDVLVNRIDPGPMFLHRDGWLEVRLDRTPQQVAERAATGIALHRAEIQDLAYSHLREAYLARTVQLLGSTGRVHLIRLPVSPGLLAVEDSLAPHFNERMAALAERSHVTYTDLSRDTAGSTFTDGSHLDRISALRMSLLIGNLIARSANGQLQEPAR